MIVVVNKP